MRKNSSKLLIIVCLMVLACFGFSACRKEDNNDEVKYNIYLSLNDNLYKTLSLTKEQLKNYDFPEPDEKNGYVFTGWKTEQDEEFDFNKLNGTNISLYGEYKSYFNISSDGVLTIDKSYDLSSIEEMIIPEVFEGKDITEIDSAAFSELTNLKIVSIADAITTIAAASFRGCTSLELVNIGAASQITEIGISAFKNCTKLKSITIPKLVTKIGYDAFENCYDLETVNFNAVNCADFAEKNEFGILNNLKLCFVNTGTNTDGVNIIFGNSVEKVPAFLCRGMTSLKNVQFKDNSVCTIIGEEAFYGCTNLKTVNIPETVLKLSDRIFSDCESLDVVDIHENVTEIGICAFSGCLGLKEINFNAKNCSDNYNKSAFLKAGDNSNNLVVSIGKNVEKIPAYMFEGCGITQIKFDDDTKCSLIDKCAFYSCKKLKEITIPETITKIEDKAFLYCQSVETINFNAVECADFTEESLSFDLVYDVDFKECVVNFGRNVKKVPAYAFYTRLRSDYDKDEKLVYLQSVKEINFDDNSVCESIGKKAFYSCKNLIKIEIPKNILFIYEGAFENCGYISEINYNASVCLGYSYDINYNYPFEGVGLGCEKSTLIIGKDVEYIPDNMFAMASITDVVFDNESNCELISEGAFSYCTRLTRIVLSPNVQNIEFAFKNMGSAELIIYILSLGTPQIDTSNMTKISAIYHYLEYQPQETGKYWHYVNGEPTVW